MVPEEEEEVRKHTTHYDDCGCLTEKHRKELEAQVRTCTCEMYKLLVKKLELELLEQARLLGVGGSKEASLMGNVERLSKELAEQKEITRKTIERCLDRDATNLKLAKRLARYENKK